jgi:sec-independent protein translocase protein TatB
VCGVSGTELVLIILVALVVAGPKDLPRMLRTVGQYAGRLRRMAAELRAQSGIDDALRTEGLADDINEIRKLARGELDGVARAARYADDPGSQAPDYAAAALTALPAAASAFSGSSAGYRDGFTVAREREYPRDGADCYGCLPDNAIVYLDVLPKSGLARDPLYMLGDEAGVFPPEPEPPATPDETAPDPEPPAPREEPAPRAEAETDGARPEAHAHAADPAGIAAPEGT